MKTSQTKECLIAQKSQQAREALVEQTLVKRKSDVEHKSQQGREARVEQTLGKQSSVLECKEPTSQRSTGYADFNQTKDCYRAQKANETEKHRLCRL